MGFDDIALSSLISPELTTIRQPIQEMAQQAVSLIVDNSEQKKQGARFILPVTLIQRETTKRKGIEA